MEFKDLIHISGKSGLFEIVGQRTNGVIARSLDDKTSQFYSSRLYQFTPLDSIEMYTTGNDNVHLKKVMRNAQEKISTHPPVDANSPVEELKAYFKTILPDYDDDRVKVSDIKKFVKWFAICKDMNLADDEQPAENVSAAE